MAVPNEGGSMFRLLNSATRPRELNGNVDLVTYYGLREHYEQFCKKSLPASIAETRYLRDVVGETDIRKGEGMELGQLLHIPVSMEASDLRMQLFDIEVLRQAFTLRENGHISLPEAEKGLPTVSGNAHDDKEEKKHKHKHKKHKHKHKEKHKGKERDKDKEKDRGEKGENGDDQPKKHRKKKRRHNGDEDEADGHRHKKKKHKHSQVLEVPKHPQ